MEWKLLEEKKFACLIFDQETKKDKKEKFKLQRFDQKFYGRR